MAYAVLPASSLGRAPTPLDDACVGFVIGSTAVDPTTTPPTLYVCADNAIGAAVWVVASGVSVQADGTTVGHAYAINFAAGNVSVSSDATTITFTPPSGWSNRLAFVASANQTFFPAVGLSVEPGRNMVTRNGLIVSEGVGNDYVTSAQGVTFAYALEADTVVQIFF